MLKIVFGRKLIRPVSFLILSILFVFLTQTLIWIPLAILALFFLAVDVFGINKNKSESSPVSDDFENHQPGLLANYVVDSTKSYGLFLVLLDEPIFVDIRQDEFLEERKHHAIYLFQNINALENNLKEFLKSNREYVDRKITYIGLHSKDCDAGEIFWEPEGYTRLHGLKFVLD